MVSASDERQRGRVMSFDADLGLGTVESATGAVHTFHCIEIIDGTRNIAVGSDVSFRLLAKFGRYEAADIGP